jgi:2,4-dienoyl-CoA reductase-like NADH-dependent reductase (Old Yellow Enzyme family)
MTQPMLFTPLTIRGVRLKNRVVVAPMHQYSAVEGFATDWHLVNAGKYAQGGAGLVIMESTKVARNGCGTVGNQALIAASIQKNEIKGDSTWVWKTTTPGCSCVR